MCKSVHYLNYVFMIDFPILITCTSASCTHQGMKCFKLKATWDFTSTRETTRNKISCFLLKWNFHLNYHIELLELLSKIRAMPTNRKLIEIPYKRIFSLFLILQITKHINSVNENILLDLKICILDQETSTKKLLVHKADISATKQTFNH